MKSNKVKLGLGLFSCLASASIIAPIGTSCYQKEANNTNELSLNYANDNMNVNLGFTNPNLENSKSFNNLSTNQINQYINNLEKFGKESFDEIKNILNLNQINDEANLVDQFNNLDDFNKEKLLDNTNMILDVFEKQENLVRYKYKYYFLWDNLYLTNYEAKCFVNVLNFLSGLGTLSDVNTGTPWVDMALKIGGIIGAFSTIMAESINHVIKNGSGIHIVLVGGFFPIRYLKWI